MINNMRLAGKPARSGEFDRTNIRGTEIRLINETEAFALREIALAPAKARIPPAYPTAPDQFHVGAFFEGIIVSAASFIIEDPDVEDSFIAAPYRSWRVRAMATLPSFRRRGCASLVLNHGIDEIRNRRGVVIWCNGRVTAAPFYEHHGFRQIGNIRHLPNLPNHYRFVRELVDVDNAPISFGSGEEAQ